jgi:5-methylcytosine-specific restriction endonuclease McrA
MRKKIERVGYLVPIENRKFGDDNYSRNPEFRKWLSETRRGKNNPNWDKHTNFLGGKTEYRGFDWRTAKKASKQRDDYRCVSCGMTEEEHIAKCGQGLQIDHIIPYKVSKDNSLNNLQTLCSLCHGKKWKHDYYVIKEAVSLV